MAHNVADIRYNVEKANRTDGRVQNLACYIDKGLLRLVHRRMDRNKASGIDKVTKLEYETNLEENLTKLVARMKDGTYSAQFASTDCPFRMNGAGSSVEAV